jgi:hypothetical protein
MKHRGHVRLCRIDFQTKAVAEFDAGDACGVHEGEKEENENEEEGEGWSGALRMSKVLAVLVDKGKRLITVSTVPGETFS